MKRDLKFLQEEYKEYLMIMNYFNRNTVSFDDWLKKRGYEIK